MTGETGLGVPIKLLGCDLQIPEVQDLDAIASNQFIHTISEVSASSSFVPKHKLTRAMP